MLKYLTFFMLFAIGLNSSSAADLTPKTNSTLKALLQGEWNCLRISDSHGSPAAGESQNVGAYLKFRFHKANLYLSLAPFDNGLKLPILIGEHSFFIISEDRTKVEYQVDSITTESLVLSAVNENGELLTYFFKKAASDVFKSFDRDTIRTCAMAIVIYDEHQNFARLKSFPISNPNYFFFYNASVHYLISNEVRSYLPCPHFIRSKRNNFSSYFLEKFDKKMASDVDSSNYELIVEFKISDKTIKNIKIVNSVSYRLDSHVFDILNNSGKFWKTSPDNRGETKIRFSFIVVRGIKIEPSKDRTTQGKKHNG